ncbi:hypothetical protein D3C74_439670 [compost metagenome]
MKGSICCIRTELLHPLLQFIFMGGGKLGGQIISSRQQQTDSLSGFRAEDSRTFPLEHIMNIRFEQVETGTRLAGKLSGLQYIL